jgi:hypothetical protein
MPLQPGNLQLERNSVPTLMVFDGLKASPLRGDIEILINSLNRGHLNPRGHTEYRLEAGLHTIRVRINGDLYPAKQFRLSDYETLIFEFCVKGVFQKEFHFQEHRRLSPKIAETRSSSGGERFRVRFRQPAPY